MNGRPRGSDVSLATALAAAVPATLLGLTLTTLVMTFASGNLYGGSADGATAWLPVLLFWVLPITAIGLVFHRPSHAALIFLAATLVHIALNANFPLPFGAYIAVGLAVAAAASAWRAALR